MFCGGKPKRGECLKGDIAGSSAFSYPASGRDWLKTGYGSFIAKSGNYGRDFWIGQPFGLAPIN